MQKGDGIDGIAHGWCLDGVAQDLKPIGTGIQQGSSNKSVSLPSFDRFLMASFVLPQRSVGTKGMQKGDGIAGMAREWCCAKLQAELNRNPSREFKQGCIFAFLQPILDGFV